MHVQLQVDKTVAVIKGISLLIQPFAKIQLTSTGELCQAECHYLQKDSLEVSRPLKCILLMQLCEMKSVTYYSVTHVNKPDIFIGFLLSTMVYYTALCIAS